MQPETRRFAHFLHTAIRGGCRFCGSHGQLFLMCSVIWILQVHSVFSQDTAHQYMKFSRTSVNVENGQLTGIDVQITNRNKNMLKTRLTIKTDEELELVSKQDDTISIQPGHSYFHSAKIHVPVRTRAQEGLRVVFELRDSTGRMLEQREVLVSVNESRNVDFYILENTLQIRYVQDVVVLVVRLHNTGNTDEVIRLMAKTPVLPEDKRYVTREFFIPAFTDTVLELTRATSRIGYSLGNFQATITATYADGDIVGIGLVDVQNLRTSKRFHEQQSFRFLQNYQNENMLELNGQYLFTQYESYQVVGGSSMHFNNTLVKYNVDAQFWKDPNIPAYVRNTYVDIQGAKLGLLLGNINRNYDIVLSGRGAAVSLQNKSKSTRWETGWMEEDYNLIGSNYGIYVPGRATWLNNIIQKQHWNSNSTLILERNTILAEDDALASTNIFWNVNKHLRFNLLGGGSYSRSTAFDSAKWGGSGGIVLQGRWNKVGFSTDNQYYSAYYPGIKRGVANFIQRFYWTPGRFSYGINYALYQSRPQYITPGNSSVNHSFSEKMELSFGGPLGADANFVVMPNYYREISKYFNISSQLLTAEIRSLDGGLQINYSNVQRKRFLFMLTEFGTYQAPLVNGNESKFHLRFSGSVRLSWLSLSVYQQLGEFYAGDVANRFFQKTPPTNLLNVTPTLRHKFFRQKLDVEFGVTYTKSNLGSTGSQLYGRTEYTLQNADKIYVSLRNYQYLEYGETMNDFRFGYRKSLPIARVATGRKSISVFVFHDLNNNNKFDQQVDSVAEGVVVSINKELLFTSGSGRVVYKGLPKGTYTVSVPSIRGWYGAERIVEVSERTGVEIALHKNCILSGRIEYREPKGFIYDEAEKKEQLLVRATAADGTVYSAKTAEDGTFIFYIPPGKYDVSILPSEYSDKIDCFDCVQPVTLTDGAATNIVFHMAVKERQIKLQKFVSPNIKKQ